ncbi:MAG TPA: hypothetical protein PKD09_11025 [Aggregatilinea sp.]|uniref:hypothetical protein n=1 Tax=Aggregatilinea sp. TaxID=2806333 RepID=UPI002B8B8289|nr:hypothetical protein [Aggregatilinea sp.]HML22174.1 hypothetical protein [Aggregatilinea sp.]
MNKNITYQPPSPDVIEHFAHAVCSELGGDDAQPEVERGLASLTKVIARILANDLNRQQSEFDNRIE